MKKIETIVDPITNIKFDVETFNNMICPIGIDTEPKNLAQFPKSDGKVTKVVKLNCLDSSENEIAVMSL